MVNIRCWKCGGKATGSSFDDARTKLNHAIGRSRGIKCGDNYNCIEEIKDPIVPESATQEEEAPKSIGLDDALKVPYTAETPKSEIPETTQEVTVKTDEGSWQHAEGKSEHITLDEAKQSKKKSKKFSY